MGIGSFSLGERGCPGGTARFTNDVCGYVVLGAHAAGWLASSPLAAPPSSPDAGPDEDPVDESPIAESSPVSPSVAGGAPDDVAPDDGAAPDDDAPDDDPLGVMVPDDDPEGVVASTPEALLLVPEPELEPLPAFAVPWGGSKLLPPLVAQCTKASARAAAMTKRSHWNPRRRIIEHAPRPTPERAGATGASNRRARSDNKCVAKDNSAESARKTHIIRPTWARTACVSSRIWMRDLNRRLLYGTRGLRERLREGRGRSGHRARAVGLFLARRRGGRASV